MECIERRKVVYEESVRRLDGSGAALPLDALTGAAGIIRHFIEDYHEKLEADFVFPRFEKAGKLVELVATLRDELERKARHQRLEPVHPVVNSSRVS